VFINALSVLVCIARSADTQRCEDASSHHGWPGRSHSPLHPKHGCVTITITPSSHANAYLASKVRVHQVHTAVF